MDTNIEVAMSAIIAGDATLNSPDIPVVCPVEEVQVNDSIYDGQDSLGNTTHADDLPMIFRDAGTNEASQPMFRGDNPIEWWPDLDTVAGLNTADLDKSIYDLDLTWLDTEETAG
jgi:hypothetical protein